MHNILSNAANRQTNERMRNLQKTNFGGDNNRIEQNQTSSVMHQQMET